jgi:uncharacterized protein
VKKVYFFGVVAAVICPVALGASFDCDKASNFVERTICSDKQLSDMDESLAATYKSAAATAGNGQMFKARQRTWIAEERNKCLDASCLKGAYATRLAELAGAKAPSVGKEVKISGRIEWGQDTSSIIQDGGPLISFESKSAVGSKVFNVCKVNDVCEIVGTVDGNDVLIAVGRVQKLKAGGPADERAPSQSKPIADNKGKKEGGDRDSFVKEHWNDSLTIDYAVLMQSIGSTQKKDRPASGTIRTITLGAYLNWERKATEEWQFALWNAQGIDNKNVVYNNCLHRVEEQWTKSFGYRETVLRSSAFINDKVDLNKAQQVICSPR